MNDRNLDLSAPGKESVQCSASSTGNSETLEVNKDSAPRHPSVVCKPEGIARRGIVRFWFIIIY